MNTIKSSTTKVVKTSRAFRVWIEGNKLVEAGFLPGTNYSLEFMQTGIKLKRDPSGNKTVSSCNRNGKSRPIVDLHSKEIGEHFEAGTVLNVNYSDNLIRFVIA